jgi:hypothetical protein
VRNRVAVLGQKSNGPLKTTGGLQLRIPANVRVSAVAPKTETFRGGVVVDVNNIFSERDAVQLSQL